MRWELTDEQVEIRDEFAAWLDHLADSETLRTWDEQGPVAFERALAEAGWTAVGVPEDGGGAGGGLLQSALVAESLGTYAVPSGRWLSSAVALPAVAGRPDVLLAVSEGAALGLATPADSLPDAVLAHPDQLPELVDGKVSGVVPLVLGARAAGHLVVPVAVGGDQRLALVPCAPDSVSLAARPLLDRTRDAADVTFEAAPAEVLDIDAGEVLAACSLRAAVLVAADALGASQRMLDLAVTYSRQREQFGVPIGSFQAVKHAAATVLVGVEAGRSILYPAAVAVEQKHENAAPWASTAKAQVCASAVAAADSSLTMHGAIGYTWEHDLHRSYKRAKLDARLFGAPAAWNERLAAHLRLEGAPA